MAPEQDWCLNCGAAAPGRLSEKPGWRAFSTIAVLTALLVLGAAAASFAALSSDKRKPAVATAPAQVAQAAPPAAVAPPATPVTPPASTKKAALPKVKAPAGASAGTSPVTPVKPTSALPKTPAPVPSSSAPRSTTSSPTTPTSTTPRTTTPKPTAPVAIKLDPSAGSTYDPSGRAAATGDAGKALDGDASTSWYLDPSTTEGPIGAGYTINLGEQRAVKRIQLTTTTPGFRVEVYATDEATPPPEITDTRWSHITNASNVGSGSGTQTIVVGGGTSKYQTVLLWVTQRPTDGARVRFSELKVLG
ncbi:MAG: hypothetical protein ABI950_07980 [Solirubrobacteraceae bacterium]